MALEADGQASIRSHAAPKRLRNGVLRRSYPNPSCARRFRVSWVLRVPRGSKKRVYCGFQAGNPSCGTSHEISLAPRITEESIYLNVPGLPCVWVPPPKKSNVKLLERMRRPCVPWFPPCLEGPAGATRALDLAPTRSKNLFFCFVTFRRKV